MLNLFLPGTGQVYLEQRRLGFVLMALFLGCFAGVLGMFLVGYAKYLSLAMSGDILQEHRLERIGRVFQIPWLLGMSGIALVIYVIAFIALKPPPNMPGPSPQNRSDRSQQL